MVAVDRIEEHSFISSALTPGSVVVDLGVRKGGFSLEVARRYGCRVLGAEPIRDFCHELHGADSRLTVHNVAVGGRNTQLPLYLNQVGDASVLPALAESDADTEDVLMVSLQEFLQNHGVREIDLLKVDIEGAEIEMIRHAPRLLFDQIKQITLEYHDFLAPGFAPAIVRTDARLRSYGYDRIQFSLRDRHDVLYYRGEVLGVAWVHRWWIQLRYKYWRGLGRALRRHLEVVKVRMRSLKPDRA